MNRIAINEKDFILDNRNCLVSIGSFSSFSIKSQLAACNAPVHPEYPVLKILGLGPQTNCLVWFKIDCAKSYSNTNEKRKWSAVRRIFIKFSLRRTAEHNFALISV